MALQKVKTPLANRHRSRVEYLKQVNSTCRKCLIEVILQTAVSTAQPQGFWELATRIHKSTTLPLFPLHSTRLAVHADFFSPSPDFLAFPIAVDHLDTQTLLKKPNFHTHRRWSLKMHPSLATALFSLLPLSLAVNIPITVGDGKLAFNPSVVTANVGDTLSFSYYPRNHSVAQSSFADPCSPLGSGGFFSGFQPLSAGPGPVEFVVQVNDTNPIWIYCSQPKGSHCQNGMAMVVNQP